MPYQSDNITQLHNPQDLQHQLSSWLENWNRINEHLSMYFRAGRLRRTSWRDPTNTSNTSAWHPLQQRDVGSC